MDKLQQIRLPIVKEFEEFKSLFDASLQSSNPLLSEVLTYIKQRNGKMMRPILTLLMAKLFGEINYSALHAALSLELLHTASLVHDDVVDESDKRRGQSSVNAIYNNKVSVLVGDYMLATSLKHSAMTGSIRIVDLVARLGQNLAEGEIIQLNNINASTDKEYAIAEAAVYNQYMDVNMQYTGDGVPFASVEAQPYLEYEYSYGDTHYEYYEVEPVIVFASDNSRYSREL